jgi:rhamnosyltransferase
VTAFWPDGHEVLVKKAFPQREFDYLFESAGPGCTYVLESSLASQLQKIIRDADDSIFRIDYHDWLAYAFARAHKFKWIIDDWSSMAYRQHRKNQIGANAGWKSFWLRLKKVLSGYGFEQSLLIADLIQVSTITVVRRGLRGGRIGYFWLSSRANQCRRRWIDKFLFFISCLILAVIKPLG